MCGIIYGIDSLKDGLELVSYIVTSFSLLIIMYSYFVSRKQVHFATMGKCINDFREIMKPTELPYDTIVEQYIDLVSEEFFYFENKYLPIDVTIEWVDGMIDYLPFFDVNEEFIKSQNWPTLTKNETIRILNNYPRVLKTIQLKENINFDLVHLYIVEEEDRKQRRDERDKLIILMISKLNINFWTKHRLKKKIVNR